MKMLALNTATQVASVAVMTQEKLLSENIIDYKLKHSKKLMLSLDTMLSSLEMTTSDVDIFAVAVGPGSFTGLRIGLATIKALAQVTQKPIVPVSTLEALAYNIAYADGLVVPVLDARRNQVYTAAFQVNGTGTVKRCWQDQALSIPDLKDKLEETQRIYFLGDGTKVVSELINGQNRTLVMPALRTCKASSVGSCAFEHLEDTKTYLTLEPSYLRPSYAEE